MKVLIADDDESIREYMRLVLEHAGHKVECVDDGMQAWAKASMFEPDVMILDEHMPEMTGLQLAEQFNRQGSDVPIILATADVSDKVKEQAIRAGIADFIAKPTSQEEVLSRITSVMQRKRSRAGVVPVEFLATMNALKGLLAATQASGFCVLCRMHGGHDPICEAGRAEVVIQRLG